jgi:hypothetical protein
MTGPVTEIEVVMDQLPEAQVSGERGGQQEPRAGHQAVIIEGRVQPVEGVP